MFKITFCDGENNIKLSDTTIECKTFAETCDNAPSDRHAYSIKFFMNPISIGRLPIQGKNFLRFIRSLS